MEKKFKTGKTGMNDSPSSDDLFDIKAYTDGLSKFVATCSCPMTIAIQGDWGTGKTSMMQRIKKNNIVSEKCISVDLNTWEYSQFELGNNLPIVFYTALIEKMGGKKASPEIKENVGKAVKGILQFCFSVAEENSSRGILSLVAGAAKAGTEAWNPANGDRTLVEATDALKTNFENVLNARLKSEKDKNRMIIFIDDLDRIEPKRAVELMEILKILLEVDKCVFVLAIDYDVVVRGIKAKYGADMDEKKARSFFDKIIQVPFSLPVGSYNIELYVSKLLLNMKDENKVNGLLMERENDSANKGDSELVAKEEVIELIRHSVGCNPRAIKRLINSFSLLFLIREAQNKEEKSKEIECEEEIVLFASLCLQLSYGRIYDYLLLIGNSREDVEGLFDLMTRLDPKKVKNDEIYKKIKDIRIKDSLKLDGFSEMELYQLSEFFEEFQMILSSREENRDSNNEEEKNYFLADEQYELLKKILRFASSTSIEQNNVDISEKLPAKILYVYRVVEEVLKNKKELTEATKHVAKNTKVSGKPITSSTVSDKYTRQLGGIHTKDFEKLLDEYKNGKQDLVEKLKDNNQVRYHDLIDKEFSKLDSYRNMR